MRSTVTLFGRMNSMTKRKQYKRDQLSAQRDSESQVTQPTFAWGGSVSVGVEKSRIFTQADIQEAILKFRELLSRDFEAIQLVLFGSWARNDSQADKDVDVAVLFSGKLAEISEFVDMKLTLASLSYDVLLLTGVRLRPYPIWEAEWLDPEHSCPVDPELVKHVIREGTIL